jgi:hypothetical protein
VGERSVFEDADRAYERGALSPLAWLQLASVGPSRELPACRERERRDFVA